MVAPISHIHAKDEKSYVRSRWGISDDEKAFRPSVWLDIPSMDVGSPDNA